MKKITTRFDDDFYEDVRELARRKHATMSGLIRYALDKTFEDDLDVISGERSYEEMLANPGSTITLDEYLRKRGITLDK